MIESKQDVFALAAQVEAAAEQELCSRWHKVEAGLKADGSVITAADLAMQARLTEELAGRFPQVRMLGEEMPAAQQARLLSDSDTPLWCLDPLDGTGNFAAGIPFFSVSLALVVDGMVQAGVVHDPVRKESFTAVRGAGAWLNGEPLSPRGDVTELSAASGLIDFKRLRPSVATRLAVRPPYRSQRSFGSVALDWCWIAAERCHLYLHGGQRLWDYAAGALVLQQAGAAGGLLERLDGDWQQRLVLEPRIAVAASTPQLLAEWRDWLLAAPNV